MFFKNKKTKEFEYSNVVSDAILSKEADKALEFEANVFTQTFGPYAYNTILEDQFLNHTISKDGYTVYQNIVMYDRIARVMQGLIKKISGSLNEIVGDGTTSAVIIANELKRLKKLIKKYKVSPKTVSILLKCVTDTILNKIDVDYKFNISDLSPDTFSEIISRIATVSLNNDKEKGKFVADIFKNLEDPANGFINVESSRNSETSFSTDRGFEIHRGYIMPEMVTEPDERTTILKNCRILLIRGDMANNDIDAFNSLLTIVTLKWQQPLVVIAGGFTQTIKEIFRQSIIRHAEKTGKLFPFLAIEIDAMSNLGIENLLDIEAAIGATAIRLEDGKNLEVMGEEQLDNVLGSCEMVKADGFKTSIIRGNANVTKVANRIQQIDTIIEGMKSEAHIDHRTDIIKQSRRKACLRSDMITLYVGGQSAEEKDNMAALFDDAVRGCKSAAKHGILPGCHITIPYIIKNDMLKCVDAYANEYSDKLVENSKVISKLLKAMLTMIYDAYVDTQCRILGNKYRNKFKCKKIAKEAIDKYSVYNLLTDTFETSLNDIDSDNMESFPTVINSADMDKRILIAATSIIDLFITSNQFIQVPSRGEMAKRI